MISVIICSRTPEIPKELSQNIQNTIGVEFELIVMDNSRGDLSIFSAYQKGLERSRFEYLCFVHDDVFFHTQNWGNALKTQLTDKKVGFIGIAGGTLLPSAPATWSFGKHYKHFLQSDKKSKKTEYHHKGQFNEKHFETVVSLDGVFLACRKKLFEMIHFDESNYDGFHCYDQDICMQSFVLGYENRVIDSILIEHYSKGYFNRHWVECQLKFWRKWFHLLPANASSRDSQDIENAERNYLVQILTKKMARAGYSNREIKNVIDEYNTKKNFEKPKMKVKISNLKIFWTRLIHCPYTLFNS